MSLDLRIVGEEWVDQALCAQTDPEAFFPEKGESTRPAKAVCMRCDVRAACLDFALENVERFGIWGGASERERRRMFNVIPISPNGEVIEAVFLIEDDFDQDVYISGEAS